MVESKQHQPEPWEVRWLAGCFWKKKKCVVKGQRAVLLSARLLNPAGSQCLGNVSAAQMVEQDWSGQGPS